MNRTPTVIGAAGVRVRSGPEILGYCRRAWGPEALAAPLAL